MATPTKEQKAANATREEEHIARLLKVNNALEEKHKALLPKKASGAIRNRVRGDAVQAEDHAVPRGMRPAPALKQGGHDG